MTFIEKKKEIHSTVSLVLDIRPNLSLSSAGDTVLAGLFGNPEDHVKFSVQGNQIRLKIPFLYNFMIVNETN